jgi:hypothetical protein
MTNDVEDDANKTTKKAISIANLGERAPVVKHV